MRLCCRTSPANPLGSSSQAGGWRLPSRDLLCLETLSVTLALSSEMLSLTSLTYDSSSEPCSEGGWGVEGWSVGRQRTGTGTQGESAQLRHDTGRSCRSSPLSLSLSSFSLTRTCRKLAAVCQRRTNCSSRPLPALFYCCNGGSGAESKDNAALHRSA